MYSAIRKKGGAEMKNIGALMFWALTFLLPDRIVEWFYVRAGATVGDDESYWYLGRPFGWKKMLQRWARWERVYASRGFRAIPIESFIRFGGGYADHVVGLRQRRAPEEAPVYYARERLDEEIICPEHGR